MNFEPVITAAAGIFPGQHGPQPLDGFWRDVCKAQPARLASLERRWGLSREQYFSAKPGAEYKTYLDVAYTISPDSGCESDVGIGVAVVSDLLSQVPAIDKRRTGLCLATLWTEQEYMRADSAYVLSGSKPPAISSAARDVQSGVLAAAIGLEGPALAVDTACASSLYAIDAALAMIETGSADSVVVLGLNTHIPPFLYLGFSKLTALSPRGRILPFSQDASGIIISEAVAAILVESRHSADAAKRRPLAAIRGLGLSADGGEQSVFAPGAQGQSLAYQRAYANCDPAHVGYVEAHGTATVLGDKTEIESLDTFFSQHLRGRKLPIGSAKALIGHSLGTAGLVSVVKALRMLAHGVIPPHIPVEPNSRLERSCLRLPSSAENWPEELPSRAIGISSFGFGGANAHLVLGRPAPAASPAPTQRPVWRPIAISQAAGALGTATSNAQIAALFAESPRPAEPFPFSRFWNGQQPELFPDGHFLPAELELESVGLRMGPNGLRRLDPFQRLCLDLARKVLNSAEVPRQDIGIICCSNLGGETGLQLSRHYAAHFNGQNAPGGRHDECKPTLEAIASSLPSLASGFAAYHLGIRGFHQTISGESGTFWRLLSLSGYWLQDRCQSLVLVAGRHLKSPLDLAPEVTHPGEGAVALLLRPAAADADPVAIITAFCPAAQLLPGSLPNWMDICQLDGAAPAGQRGTAQAATGFLHEAAGIESLLRLLLAPGTGLRGIEVRHGASPTAYLIIDKLRELDLQPASVETPVAARFQPAVTRRSSVPVVPFIEWQRETELAIRSFLRAQSSTAALLNHKRPAPAPIPHRAPENIVLANLSTGTAGHRTATLVVNEAHNYFFDHPLDHVPGILLLEGILQLAEHAVNSGEYLRSIDLKFRKFCEKTRPILLTSRLGSLRELEVEIQQDQASIATCNVTCAPQPDDVPMLEYDAANPPSPFPDPRMLHKRDSANVLVSAYRQIPGKDSFECDLLPPVAGHILNEGTDGYVSLLYILETARQFVMLLAHVFEGIPLDQPMNLVRIQLWLDRPVPRTARLRMECARQPVRRIGGMVLADLELTLTAGTCHLGGAKIKSQVVDKKTYQQQRRPAGAPK